AAGVVAGIGLHTGQPALVVVVVGLVALGQAVLGQRLFDALVARVVDVVHRAGVGHVFDADLVVRVVVAVDEVLAEAVCGFVEATQPVVLLGFGAGGGAGHVERGAAAEAHA